jgi:hypothetical protein
VFAKPSQRNFLVLSSQAIQIRYLKRFSELILRASRKSLLLPVFSSKKIKTHI